MTLLELAKYKGCSMQTILSQIKDATGEIIPIKINHELSEDHIKIIAPEMYQNLKPKEGKEEEIKIFNSDENEMVGIVSKVYEDSILIELLRGELLSMLPDKFKSCCNDIRKGNIIGLSFLKVEESNSEIVPTYYMSDIVATYCMPHIEWVTMKLMDTYIQQKTIKGKILYPYRDKGIFVNVFGFRALMPNDHIGIDFFDYTQFKNSEINVKVISCEKKQGSLQVLLSHKKISIDEKRKKLKEECKQEKVEVGTEFDGIVSKVVDYGVFVNFGNKSGLVHYSELSWVKLYHLDEVFKENDPIKVKVIGINDKGISLSHKQCLPNPWELVKRGDIVVGTVINVIDLGVLVELSLGVNGFLHISEMPRSQYEGQKNSNFNKSRISIDVVILSVDLDKKNIELSTLHLIKNYPEIWETIDDRYIIDQSYVAKIISIVEEKGVWLELEEGVDIFVPSHELQWSKTNRAINNLIIGNEARVSVKKIDKFERKLIGSIRVCEPNPWVLAKESIDIGMLLSVIVLTISTKIVKIYTDDEFQLLGEIPLSEISWIKSIDELENKDIPEPGELIKAQVVVWDADKCNLKLSLRQLESNPWNDISVGTEVFGIIKELNNNNEVLIHIDNGLSGQSKEMDLKNHIGERMDFKIIGYNQHTREIRLSHKRIHFDNEKDMIIRSFFLSNKINDKTTL